PRVRLLRLAERGLGRARGTARVGLCGRTAGSHVPGAAALPALCGPESRAACVRSAGDPAGLALRDGERDRLRRGAELVACPPFRPAAARGATGPGVTEPAPPALGASAAPSIRCPIRQPCDSR